MAYTSRRTSRSRRPAGGRSFAAGSYGSNRRSSGRTRTPARGRSAPAPQTLRLVIEQTGAGVVARPDNSYPFAPIQRANRPTRAKR